MNVHRQEQLASLMAGGGLVYGFYIGTQRMTSLAKFSVPELPAAVCAIGVLIWLHAKWRRSTSMNR
jgi:hypothetical protein